MKTTIDISPSILEASRELAARQGVTLKMLVEQGLRHVLSSEKREAPFKLRDASVSGNGLQVDLQGSSWERLRDMAYEGRGA
jgi:hypothetical protein